MTERDLLDDLFAEARAKPPAASPDFMARVLADAERLQPPAPAITFAPPVARPGLWSRFVSALGGAAAVAGIGSAAMAGLVIGYVQPEPLVALADGYGIATGLDETLQLLPEYDSLLTIEASE